MSDFLSDDFLRKIGIKKEDEAIYFVGIIDTEFIKEIEKKMKTKDKLHEEIKKKIEKLIDVKYEAIEKEINDYKSYLLEEHNPECEGLSEEIENIWVAIYDKLEIPEEERNKKFSVDRHSGIVTKVTEYEESLEGFIKNSNNQFD